MIRIPPAGLAAAALGVLLGMGAPSVPAAELLVGNKAADSLWRLSLEDGRRLGEASTAPGPAPTACSSTARAGCWPASRSSAASPAPSRTAP